MSIDEICDKYGIENYTINDDKSIDVNGDVNLKLLTITKLPLKFGSVSGYFDCPLGLTTLEGSPKYVGGNFNCSSNELTSLSGSPESVGGHFDCTNNKLITLEGGPVSVDGDFDCSNNKLTDLKGSPNKVGWSFKCFNNELTDLKGSPEYIGDNLFCSNNKITSLENNTKHIGIRIWINNNPISNILGTNIVYEDLSAFNSFRILKDGVINLKRLKYFYSIFDFDTIDLDLIKKFYKIV